MKKILIFLLIGITPVLAGDKISKSTYAVFDLDNVPKIKNRKNRSLTAVVGDSLADNFMPRLEISAWGGESRLAIDLLPEGKPSVVSAGINSRNGRSGIEYTADSTMSFDIYTLADGDLEWEVLLNGTPQSNILYFGIETDNLNFYYQDTACFPDDIEYHGPEWAHGSYAVYHAQRRHNCKLIQGRDTLYENYSTGKAFHIKRPRAFDNAGHAVWCNMNIDTVAGRMTIEIPHDFLDHAEYPVVVDPTFGKSLIGAWDLSIDNYRHTVLWNVGQVKTGKGEITGAFVFCNVNGELEGTMQVKVHSYTKGADLNASQYHTSSSVVDVTDTSAHWVSCPMSGQLDDSTVYIASLQAYNSISNKLWIRGDMTAWGDVKYANFENWTVPGSLGGYASKNDGFSVYIEYTNVIDSAPPLKRRRKILSLIEPDKDGIGHPAYSWRE